MIRPLEGRSRTTPVRACPMTIPALSTAKAIRKPGKSRPASARSMIQGLRSETSPNKSVSKAKPSALSRPLGSRAEGFAKADFFGASPVASALDLRNGRDPDTQTVTLSCSFRSAGAAQVFLRCQKFLCGTDLPNPPCVGKTKLNNGCA
jgi:hypothetical protein